MEKYKAIPMSRPIFDVGHLGQLRSQQFDTYLLHQKRR